MDAKKLCMVPNVAFPQIFKVPELHKYKGLSYPKIHITMYYRKMASYIDNLSGASLDWYMGLEQSKIRTWKDLSGTFLKKYKYNLNMTPTRLQLQN